MDTVDIALRLLAAVLAGAALGINRDLHNKPIGVRTLGLVGLGSALAVMLMDRGTDFGPMSRVIQGILTGIGFLGAGVIIRTHEGQQVHGLTTAACTWVTACIGAACGAAEWRMLLISLLLVFVLLVGGGVLERFVHACLRRHPEPAAESSSSDAVTHDPEP